MVAFRFFLILRCFVVNRENNKIQAHAQFQRKQSPQLTVLILMVLNSVLEHPYYTYTKKSFFPEIGRQTKVSNKMFSFK